MTCSAAIVFFASRSAMSFASDEMSVMNSTQQSIKRSRASLAKARSLGRISEMIFWTVALGRDRSSAVGITYQRCGYASRQRQKGG